MEPVDGEVEGGDREGGFWGEMILGFGSFGFKHTQVLVFSIFFFFFFFKKRA